MIKYSQNPSGGFGNRLFQLNFLAQLAHSCNTNYEFRSIQDAGLSINCSRNRVRKFERFLPSIPVNHLNALSHNEAISLVAQRLDRHRTVRLKGVPLGETFSKFTKVDPKKLLGILLPKKNNNLLQASIHFRGGDFKKWNPEAILSADYYETAIEILLDLSTPPESFILVTDDPSLDSYQYILKKYSKYITKSLPSEPDLLRDFALLRNSNYLISTPSTFAIWSSILGDHLEVIHSKKWVSSRIEVGDKFWEDISSNESKFLPTIKLV